MEEETANVVITFTRSSTREKGEGFTVRATEQASEADVERALNAARMARQACIAELDGTSEKEESFE